jgi:hypothetical protein
VTIGRRPPSRRASVIAALLLPLAASAGAQQPTDATTQQSREGVPEQPPGFSLTPAIGVSQLWDDNPTLKGDGDVRTGDFVTAIRPSVSLGYRGKRTILRTDYAASFDYYNRLTEQNTTDHRGGLEFTHQVTKRLQLFARDQAMFSPTTGDAALLAATVLRRQTTRMNAFRGGFEAMFSKRTTLTAAYTNQWIDFANDADAFSALLRGGHSHGGGGELRHRLTQRLSLGADYNAERATVARGAETFDVHSALGVVELILGPSATAKFGYGHAWLFTSEIDGNRDGQALEAGLDWRRARTSGTIGYRRAFLPSFGFGGTFQNQELDASIRAQLSRWLNWSGGLGYAHNDPLVPGDPTLRTVSARTSLGWVVKRRLQFEAYAMHITQDSRLAGGQVNRTRAGLQATVSEVVRAAR